MLKVAADLSGYTLAAGEPFLFEVQLQEATGAVTDLSARAFVLSFYGPGRTLIEKIDPERLVDATGAFLRFARDGRFSDGLFGQAVTVELAERYKNGRNVLATGGLTVAASSGGVITFDDGVVGQFVVRATLKANASQPGVLTPSLQIMPYQANLGTPAPIFTTAPSITGTAKVGVTLTGNDGTITNGTVTTREWLLNGTAISGATGASYLPVKTDAGGELVYRVTAQGPGGSLRVVSGGVTVAAADAPTWSKAPALSATPNVGVEVTGSDGTVVGGSVTGRQWLIDGVAITGATGSSYTPVDADAGKALAFRPTATGAGGTASATSPAIAVVPRALTVTPTAWAYPDDLKDAADGSDPLTRPNWSATGNSADRYRVGTYSNGKAVFNNNIYRPTNNLLFGPDLNTDGTDFGWEIEIDECRLGNAGASNGNAYEVTRQGTRLFDRGDSDNLLVVPGDDGLTPRITTNTVAGTGSFVGSTFRHQLQTPPAALPKGVPSVKTLYQYHKGRLRMRLMNSGDWCVSVDTNGYPKDRYDVSKLSGLTDIASRHGKVGYSNSTWTYPLLNGIRIRPLRMMITEHARYCSRTTFSSGIGRIWIKGDFRGTPVSWAYRVISKPANTVVQSWKACSSVVTDNAAGTFSLVCTIPQGGPYEIELAMTDSDGVVSNTCTKRVACGEFYITNGQSNSVSRNGAANNLTIFNPIVASQVYLPANNPEAIPLTEMGGMGTNEWTFCHNVEMSRTISDATGVPCLTLSTGVSGSPINGVAADTAFANTFVATRNLIDGVVDGILWDQGEGDRDGVYAPDTYYDQLKAIYLKMVDATGNPALPMWISPIGNFPSSSTPNGLTNWANVDRYERIIKLAYEQLIAEYPTKIQYADSKLGQVHGDGDPYHYKGTSYQQMSRRAGRSILKYRGFAVADGRGPLPKTLTRAGAVLTLAMDMNGSNGLTDLVTNSTISGDGRGTPVLSGALYGYEVSADGFASLLAISSIARSGNTLVITLAADPGKAVQIRSFHGGSYEDKFLFWGTYADGRENIPVAPIINYLMSN